MNRQRTIDDVMSEINDDYAYLRGEIAAMMGINERVVGRWVTEGRYRRGGESGEMRVKLKTLRGGYVLGDRGRVRRIKGSDFKEFLAQVWKSG